MQDGPEPLTPPAASGPPGPAAAALLFVAGALLLAYGLARSGVIPDGLLIAWQPKGILQFTTFVAIALVLGLAVARLFGTRAPLAVLVLAWLIVAYGPGAVATVGLVAAAALALGGRVARGAAFAAGAPLEAAILRAATGLGIIVGAVHLLAHFPVNLPLLHTLLLGTAIVWGRRPLREDASRLLAFCRSAGGPRGTVYAHLLLLVVLAAHSAVAAVPEVASDALATHLMVPHQVAMRGAWNFDVQRYLWALMPMGADWLYTTANLLGGELAARLSNFALLTGAALLAYGQLRRSLPPAAAAVLVAVGAAAPIAFLESASLWAENLLTLLLLAASLILARSWKQPTSRDVVAFALCAGGAGLTKSLAFCALPLLPAMAWSIAGSPMPARTRAGWSAAGLLILVAIGGAPYLHAWALTGNPLFPFFNRIFQSPFCTVDVTDQRWIGHGGADLLYQMTFHSSRYGELYDGALGFHHLLLLPAGLVVALSSWPRPARVAIAAELLVLALFLSGTQYIRYLYPFLWGALVLEGEGLRALLGRPRLRRPALAALGFVLLANLAFMPTAYYILRNFPVDAVLSRAARYRFIEDEAPSRRINETVNAVRGRSARVLYLCGPTGAFLDGVPVYANWYNPAVAGRVQSATPVEVPQILADEGITHVAMNPEDEVPAFRQWLALHARRLLSLNGHVLYEIDPEGARPGARD